MTTIDLTFDEATHTYRISGKKVPSVSRIMDALQSWEGIPKAVLEAAAEFGRHVHEACHFDNMGTLDYDALDPQLRPYVDAWRNFLRDFKAIVVASEVMVACDTVYHRYAGRLDAIVRIGRDLWLIDIKSTSTIPRTVGPQTAAYKHAHGDRKLKRRVVLLKDGGKYESKILNDPADFRNFEGALIVYRWFNP